MGTRADLGKKHAINAYKLSFGMITVHCSCVHTSLKIYQSYSLAQTVAASFATRNVPAGQCRQPQQDLEGGNWGSHVEAWATVHDKTKDSCHRASPRRTSSTSCAGPVECGTGTDRGSSHRVNRLARGADSLGCGNKVGGHEQRISWQ
jgi:hypothetical protein